LIKSLCSPSFWMLCYCDGGLVGGESLVGCGTWHPHHRWSPIGGPFWNNKAPTHVLPNLFNWISQQMLVCGLSRGNSLIGPCAGGLVWKWDRVSLLSSWICGDCFGGQKVGDEMLGGFYFFDGRWGSFVANVAWRSKGPGDRNQQELFPKKKLVGRSVEVLWAKSLISSSSNPQQQPTTTTS